MADNLISSKLASLRARAGATLGDLLHLAHEADSEDMITQITQLSQQLVDPFMFVVVGEVKAGKSSFINALLNTEEDICAVAPSPMTDTVQQIVYGDEKREVVLSPHVKRVYHPSDILKEIAIVDTPGTNTIIEHHQTITEEFIPSSDLVVFVFEAKNPYRQSAWDFFELIHADWRKKVIFVLQQADLMDPDDLTVNIQGVKDFAAQRDIDVPHVFALSAKMEQEGHVDSGYAPLRGYIKEHITDGQAPYLKVQSSMQTGILFVERIHQALQLREEQLEADRTFREEITKTLSDQAARSHRQVDFLMDHLRGSYDRIWQEQRGRLSDGLSFFSLIKRSISSIFSRKENLKTWLHDLAKSIENDMQQELYGKLSDQVDDLADAVQDMVRYIDLQVQQSTSHLGQDMELFRAMADKRASILSDLRTTFGNYVRDQTNFRGANLFPSAKDISPQVATGGGIAIIGIVLTAVTNGAVLDLTGGVVTAIGLLFAGITTGLNKRKVLHSFDEEMRRGKTKLDTQLGHQLTAYVQQVEGDIQEHFKRFDAYLEEEEHSISSAMDKVAAMRSRMKDIQTEVGEVLG